MAQFCFVLWESDGEFCGFCGVRYVVWKGWKGTGADLDRLYEVPL